jgi:7,8-dihydroneopterin aldolase/epimerase/oxygenase
LDKITLKSLKFFGKHGYYDRERMDGNEFELDVIAKGNFIKAIEGNRLDKTFNYEIAEEAARNVFSGSEEKLIETLCHKIGEQIFEKAPEIKKLKVSVRKMNPPIQSPAAYAEITMSWKR